VIEQYRVIEPEMVAIPAGEVRMGVPQFPAGAALPHPWQRTRRAVGAFALAARAVTVGEYRAFARATRYPIAEELSVDPRFGDPLAPAGFVSWIDATSYVQWLARETGKPYRLVRDAEYEYAARGGLDGARFPWGDAEPAGYADFGNPDGAPQPVASFAANGFGLYDMAGSMWCWCEERFDEVVAFDRARMSYDETMIRDVRHNRICRGGSFKTADLTALYCAHRHEDPVDSRFDCIGFRVALSLPS
jgi:formylglycine-generating enzyme required for sulfatase activity